MLPTAAPRDGLIFSLPWIVLVAVFMFLGVGDVVGKSDFLIGLGSHDITGPAADVNMMGYANMDQVASGVHFRLRARAFIVAEPRSEGKRVAFVNLDACMASQIVTIKVIERLKTRYGDLYTEENVAISGIHTHAGPGGYLQYVTYIITSLGFVRQTFDVLVDGIENAIVQAHENLRPGSILVNEGDILDAGINRSPSAHLNNPYEERKRYEHDVDTKMTLLKFVDDEQGPVGSFNWFATHGTSMSRTNSLISGDNKGAAARFMEDWFRQKASEEELENAGFDILKFGASSVKVSRRVSMIISKPREHASHIANSIQATGGELATSFLSTTQRVRSTCRQGNRQGFVAAFCQSNCGDVSPNVGGTFCIDTGLPCDFNHSTCNGKNELCYGRGPGYPDEFESTRIIGDRQFKKAVDLFSSASETVKGKVDYRHKFIDFSKLKVSIGDQEVKTCPAAMGFAFAAGTTDGPGAFDFKQGDDKGNPFWRLVRNVLKKPSKAQIECQHPKPILLTTGEMKEPYEWAPAVLPIQMLQIGQVVILSVPGEFTTMAGRRLREAVKTVLTTSGAGEFDSNVHVIIAGLTNTYSQYVTTFEEYAVQRYEGASTLYGPHTLSGYIQEFRKLTAALIGGSAVEAGPPPPDLLKKQIGFLLPVVVDSTPLGVKFGDMADDVKVNASFRKGERVSARFWSACPRNDPLTEGTFALVERMASSGGDSWVPAYDDDDFCLRFRWSRPSRLSSHSHAAVEWAIPDTAQPGVYRLRHFGAAKSLFGSLRHFTGASHAFTVV
ncbi:neutral/alkaline non-lysosomal ceramidase [Wolffia australiana]